MTEELGLAATAVSLIGLYPFALTGELRKITLTLGLAAYFDVGGVPVHWYSYVTLHPLQPLLEKLMHCWIPLSKGSAPEYPHAAHLRCAAAMA